MSGAAFLTCSNSYTWIGEAPSCNQKDTAPHVQNSNVFYYGKEGNYVPITEVEEEEGATSTDVPQEQQEESSPFIEGSKLKEDSVELIIIII